MISSTVTGSVVSSPCTTMPSVSPTSSTSMPASSSNPRERIVVGGEHRDLPAALLAFEDLGYRHLLRVHGSVSPPEAEEPSGTTPEGSSGSPAAVRAEGSSSPSRRDRRIGPRQRSGDGFEARLRLGPDGSKRLQHLNGLGCSSCVRRPANTLPESSPLRQQLPPLRHGRPAARRDATSASSRAWSRRNCVFVHDSMVKSGRAPKRRLAVSLASSGRPFCW